MSQSLLNGSRRPRPLAIFQAFHHKRMRVWAAASVLLLLLAGCATTRVAEKEEEFIWPLPPETPRIKYVRSIHSEMDVGKQKGFSEGISEALFGRSRMLALRKPGTVYTDRAGKVYVTDSMWRGIAVFDFPGRRLFAFRGSGKGVLTRPAAVATDGAGRMYVADRADKRVVVFDPAGRFVTAFGGKDLLVRPTGIAINEMLGRVYVVDAWAHQVKVFSLDGMYLFSIGKQGKKEEARDIGSHDQVWNRGRGDGEFRYPLQIAIGPEGRLYVADTMNFRIQIFDPDGRFLSTFGRLGDNPGEFARPKGIAVDSEGHIYVSDAAFNNVQIFDEKGRLLLSFGGIGFGKASFWLPAGLYIDHQDRIYVVDQYNHRVQVYQYLSQKVGNRGKPAPQNRAEKTSR
ncbi:MAG: 6-bladed beta-propeller [Candidatus Methylomirabilales bacterium]